MGALTQHSSGLQSDMLRRLNEAAGAEGVRRAMRLMEAPFGKMKKDDKDQEIVAQLWVSALGHFDLETLKRQAVAACSKFKFWPSLAEFKAMCVEDRKELADKAGVSPNPPRPRLEGPREDPRDIAKREGDMALLKSCRELMEAAGEPPIDWSKPHAAEFARRRPYMDRAKHELGVG
jgi:hypothetical protein